MRRVKYVPDPTFEERFLGTSPELGRMLGTLADEAARSAESKAPRRTGILAGDIVGTVEREDATLVGRVTSQDWKTLLVERGTRHSHARPFLWPAIYETLPGARVDNGGRG